MGVHCYFAFTKIKYFVVSSKSFTPLSCNFYLFYSLYGATIRVCQNHPSHNASLVIQQSLFANLWNVIISITYIFCF